MTLGAKDFRCAAGVAFFGEAFRAIAFFVTFFGTGFLARTFFLTATFLVTLLFSASLVLTETLAFVTLRVAAFFATARFAFARTVFGAAVRRFAVDFGEARRAIARDEERLKLLVTALIS